VSFFPETIAAILAGRTVKMPYLVLLDFVDEPMRVWSGFGTITAGGHDWSGLGEVGSIQGLEQAINGEAPESTFILSGINPEIVRLTREEFEDKAADRLARVYVQFTNAEDDRPLELFDQPFALWSGQMKTARFELQSTGLRRITVGCESRFSLRSRPNSSQYTDRDQQKRFPGDRGFEFVPTLRNKVVTWPDF
jgi:hypothetical protein